MKACDAARPGKEKSFVIFEVMVFRGTITVFRIGIKIALRIVITAGVPLGAKSVNFSSNLWPVNQIAQPAFANQSPEKTKCLFAVTINDIFGLDAIENLVWKTVNIVKGGESKLHVVEFLRTTNAWEF